MPVLCFMPDILTYLGILWCISRYQSRQKRPQGRIVWVAKEEMTRETHILTYADLTLMSNFNFKTEKEYQDIS